MQKLDPYMSMHDVLAILGIEQGEGGNYYTPFKSHREDKPSFSVYGSQNTLWRCFSTDKKGVGVVDFIQQLYNLSDIPNGTPTGKTKSVFMQVCDIINGAWTPDNVAKVEAKKKEKKEKPKMELRGSGVLSHPKLKRYLLDRGIADFLFPHIWEIKVFNPKAGKNGILFTYLAVPNVNGGWAFRAYSSNYKGTIGKGGYSFINNKSDIALVYEGYIDYLSYSTIKRALPKEDIYILNGTANATKLDLSRYKTIKLYLDNGYGGDEATIKIKDKYPHAHDMRKHYRKFDDMNDFLLQKPKEKREFRLVRKDDKLLIYFHGEIVGTADNFSKAREFINQRKK